MRHCGVLSIVRPQLKDPLELFVNRGEFVVGSVFLYRQLLKGDVKTYSSSLSFEADEVFTNED